MATKYVSALNGQQMDSALTDMAYHTSEAFAIGERNGVPVSSGDVAYHNNAKYYAEQASADATEADAAAARAEAAVPPSTAGAVFFDRAQALTDAQKEQAKANIGAGSTNRNLLDNAYFVGGGSQLGDGKFPINQRGQSSYTGDGTQLDRWKTWEANDVITLTANGVKFKSPNGNGMFQYWSEFPTTKTVTFSAIIDGNIYSVTLPEGDTQYEYIGTGFKIGISRNGKCVYMNSQNTEILIAACKLEVGTVSTLANDAPPDFGEELRKCKRRLRYVPLTRTPAVISGNTAVVTLNGIEMAGVPTPALISAGGARDAGGLQSITSATVTGFTYNTPTVQFALAGNLNYVIGYVYDTVIQLSCEL